jgi:hypothetical protein
MKPRIFYGVSFYFSSNIVPDSQQIYKEKSPEFPRATLRNYHSIFVTSDVVGS